MTEWRLFPEGTVPEFTTLRFFRDHPWIAPMHQLGHTERTRMVAELIRDYFAGGDLATITDLGCGDGSLLNQLRPLRIAMWGYDAGEANVEQARAKGLAVSAADILQPRQLALGELLIATEVVEHLADPHGWLAGFYGVPYLVLSSPSAETDEWHYEHHAWAWDLAGYRTLVEGAGWRVLDQRECLAGVNFHGGERREQRFQAILCAWPDD